MRIGPFCVSCRIEKGVYVCRWVSECLCGPLCVCACDAGRAVDALAATCSGHLRRVAGPTALPGIAGIAGPRLPPARDEGIGYQQGLSSRPVTAQRLNRACRRAASFIATLDEILTSSWRWGSCGRGGAEPECGAKEWRVMHNGVAGRSGACQPFPPPSRCTSKRTGNSPLCSRKANISHLYPTQRARMNTNV